MEVSSLDISSPSFWITASQPYSRRRTRHSLIFKILERLIGSRLDVHLNRIGTTPSVQLAYRRNNSAETTFAKVSDISMAEDRGDVSLLALVDLSAPFDMVDHGIPLQRLHTSNNINGLALGWFRSCLTGRRESVLYGGATTSAALVEYGVPQGAVLGPLLFVLYTSDVPRGINAFGLLSVVYADDTQIYIKVKQLDIPVAKVRVEDYIAKVKQWLPSNGLRLNPSKTEAMWYTS